MSLNPLATFEIVSTCSPISEGWVITTQRGHFCFSLDKKSVFLPGDKIVVFHRDAIVHQPYSSVPLQVKGQFQDGYASDCLAYPFQEMKEGYDLTMMLNVAKSSKRHDLATVDEIVSVVKMEEYDSVVEIKTFLGDVFRLSSLSCNYAKGDWVVIFNKDIFVKRSYVLDTLFEGCSEDVSFDMMERRKMVLMTEEMKSFIKASPSFQEPLQLGDEVGDAFGCVFGGKVKKGSLPAYIPRTDEKRLDVKNQIFSWTYMTARSKMDGTSATFALDMFGNFVVCSRNQLLNKGEKKTPSYYFDLARKTGMEAFLKHHWRKGEPLFVQGEICGPKISNNHHRFPNVQLFLFNLSRSFADGGDLDQWVKDHNATGPETLLQLAPEVQLTDDDYEACAGRQKRKEGEAHPNCNCIKEEVCAFCIAEGIVVRDRLRPFTSKESYSFKVLNALYP